MRLARTTTLPASASEPFDRLARPIQRWIRDRGWKTLRPVQADAIAHVLEGESDLIVTAATAGGKTEAAFLPLLSDIADRPAEGGGFDVLYVAPLRALISDQALRLESLCERCDIAVYPWHGDIAQSRKQAARKNPSGVLLITPESLEAMFVLNGRDMPRLFAATRAVVIDELHTLLDSERGVHLRSLLTRLEIATQRRIRRIGLSATLGEMALACRYLRPDDADAVILVQDHGSRQDLRVQLRAYHEPGRTASGPDAAGKVEGSAEQEIADHLFTKLRGTRNLVFAGSRGRVESYADRLARMCVREKVPVEFLPHHASLSRERRTDVEDRLRDGRVPLTAICTSTLELGIDIGDVTCVGQIGAPFSVASLRQRLGRSGRREGQPAILRLYVALDPLDAESHPIDRLRLELIRAVAMVELLIEGWCEPPRPEALHLSTLTHQILSIIAERGGASAARLFKMLCERGPFRSVDKALFARLLRSIAEPETALIEQGPDGTLLLGRVGERIVAHYSFYAVFPTPEEYRLTVAGREIGTLPIDNVLMPGMGLIFAGRRWTVEEIDDAAKVIALKASSEGRPPKFGGGGGDIHDVVAGRMRQVLERQDLPIFLDKVAAEALSVARSEYARLGMDENAIVPINGGRTLLLPWVGTRRTDTLALALMGQAELGKPGDVQVSDVVIDIARSNQAHVEADLRMVGEEGFEFTTLNGANLVTETFHEHLGRALLVEDVLASRLAPESLAVTCNHLLRKS